MLPKGFKTPRRPDNQGLLRLGVTTDEASEVRPI
jgi:hypothetical protein